MNAINHIEAQSIHATASAAPAVREAADPSKNLILVPLSRQVSRLMGRNVSKTPRIVDCRTRRQHPACRSAAKPDRDRDS